MGDLLCDDRVDAGILQAHGVQHTGGDFRDAGLGIAQAGLGSGTFPGEGPQNVQVINLRILPAIAKGAGGGDDGIFQRHPRQGDSQIYHTISSLYRMGPSLHTRLEPFAVGTVQPMHAPKPQPIRASKLNCPPVS